MRGHRETTAARALAVALLVASPQASALPIVHYSVSALGGGLFQYNLSVDNGGGAEALSGLDVLHAGSVFGLGAGSAIGEPAGWMSFAPLPPSIDDLDYFSRGPASDIPLGGSLGGFSFRSTKDPSTIAGNDFAVEGIGATSATQTDLGVAQLVPEPSIASLVAAGLTALGLGRRTRLSAP